MKMDATATVSEPDAFRTPMMISGGAQVRHELANS
jgi:hypothetical protein